MFWKKSECRYHLMHFFNLQPFHFLFSFAVFKYRLVNFDTIVSIQASNGISQWAADLVTIFSADNKTRGISNKMDIVNISNCLGVGSTVFCKTNSLWEKFSWWIYFSVCPKFRKSSLANSDLHSNKLSEILFWFRCRNVARAATIWCFGRGHSLELVVVHVS